MLKNLFLKYYISKQSSFFPTQMKELIAQAMMKDLRMLFLLNYMFTLKQFESKDFQSIPKFIQSACWKYCLYFIFLAWQFPSFVLDGGGYLKIFLLCSTSILGKKPLFSMCSFYLDAEPYSSLWFC